MNAPFPQPEEYAGPPFELIDRPEQIFLVESVADGLSKAIPTVARRLQEQSSVVAVRHDRRAGQAAFAASLTVALRSLDVRVISIGGGQVSPATIQRQMSDAAGVGLSGILPPDALVRALRDVPWLTNIVLMLDDADTLPPAIFQYLALLFKLFQFQPATLSIVLIGGATDWPGLEQATLGPDWQASLPVDVIYYVGTGLAAAPPGTARLRRLDFAMNGQVARAAQAAAGVLAVITLGYVLAWPNGQVERAPRQMAAANLALPAFLPAPVLPAPVLPAPVLPAPVLPAPVLPAPVLLDPPLPAQVLPAQILPAPELPPQQAEEQSPADAFDLPESDPLPFPPPSAPPLVGPPTLAGPEALATADALPATPALPTVSDTKPTPSPEAPSAVEAEPTPPLPSPPPAAGPARGGGPGLVLMAETGDDLASLYAKIYHGVTPPPFSVVKAANPLPVKPGVLVVFPTPPHGWQQPLPAHPPSPPRSRTEMREPS